MIVMSRRQLHSLDDAHHPVEEGGVQPLVLGVLEQRVPAPGLHHGDHVLDTQLLLPWS